MSQTTTKLVLVTSVKVEQNTGKNAQRCPYTSYVSVRLSDGLVVAGGTLGGKYSENQALKEFYNDCRRPVEDRRFKHHPGYASAKLANLVP